MGAAACDKMNNQIYERLAIDGHSWQKLLGREQMRLIPQHPHQGG
jgi:hypothetical protein